DGGGCEALTIAKDGTGMLWIAYMVNGQLLVNHTIGGDDTHWSPAFFLPAPEGNPAKADDDAEVEWLPGNPGKIGIFWSNQLTQRDYFAVHVDGTPAEDPSAWKFELAGSGSSIADDHNNMKIAADGRAFTDQSVGTPLMVSGTHPVSPSVGGPGGINNVSTTKQVLDPSNGILVIASTSETNKYWHGWIEYPRPVPVVTIASPASNTKVRAGAPVIFSATATSGTDGVISSALKWISSRDGQ